MFLFRIQYIGKNTFQTLQKLKVKALTKYLFYSENIQIFCSMASKLYYIIRFFYFEVTLV